MAIPTPVAAWGFNKDLGESAGQYKDYIAGLILASNDNADHPAAAAKVGVGAYAGNNLSTGLLTGSVLATSENGLTISVWARVASVVNVIDGILQMQDGSGGYIELRVQLSTTLGRRFGWRSSLAGTPFYETYVAADTDWHLLTLTLGPRYFVDPEDPGAGEAADVLLYVDGIVVINQPGVNVFQSSESSLVICGLAAGNYFNGDIDALHIWQEALTPEQVAEVYNAGTGWEYAPLDTAPDTFDFTDVTDADLSTVYESDSQAVTGMDAGTAISITGGEYRINGGAWTSDAGTIDPGDTLELRLTSSGTPETAVTATVTVGTLAVDWSVTTGAVMSVVTNIIGGSPTTSRIFRSRIVQGMI